MGLSGRKEKQRIGADPRNLTWADDAAKFGQSYLAKMGWDPSKGLGVNGDGRTSHIQARQKLNLLGIGAQRGREEDMVWKQSREYEALLIRLNAASERPPAKEEEKKGGEKEGEEGEKRKEENAEAVDEDGKTPRKRKRRNGEEGNRENDEAKSKKRTKEGQEKKKKQKDKETKKDDDREAAVAVDQSESNRATAQELTQPSTARDETLTPPVVVPRPMAHRARFLKAKRMLLSSPAAMNEILGISGSTTPVSAPCPTSGADAASLAESMGQSFSLTPILEHDLTTATKSMSDYFREKLTKKNTIGKAGSSSLYVLASTASASASSVSASRSNGLVHDAQADRPNSEDGERVRFGIGAQALPQMGEGARSGQRDEDAPRAAGLGFKRDAEIAEVVEAECTVQSRRDAQEAQEGKLRKRSKKKKEMEDEMMVKKEKKEKKKRRREKEIKEERRKEEKETRATQSSGSEETKKERKSKSNKRMKDGKR